MTNTVIFRISIFQVNNATLRLPDKLVKKPPEMNKSEFHTYVFPVLTCLVSYHTHLDKSRQVHLQLFIFS